MHNSCHKCCTNVEYSQHDLSSCDCVGTACLCRIQTTLALKHHGPLHVLLLYMCLQLLCLSIEEATNSAIKLGFLLVLGKGSSRNSSFLNIQITIRCPLNCLPSEKLPFYLFPGPRPSSFSSPQAHQSTPPSRINFPP